MSGKGFRFPAWVFISAILFGASASRNLSGQTPELTLEGYEILRWDPSVPCKNMVQIEGERYALARGALLQVMDIPQGGMPSPRGTLALSTEIRSMTFENGRLYLACGYFGLVTVDVSDPDSPQVVSVLHKGPIDKVVFDGTGKVAYAVTQTANFFVLDMAKPETPKVKNTLTIQKGVANDIVRVGNMLVVAGGPRGVLVYSIKEKRSPALVSKETSLAAVLRIFVRERTVLAMDSEKGLVVLEYPKWEKPSVKGSLPDATAVLSAAVLSPDLVMTAEGEGGVRWISIADPMVPQTVASLPGSAPAFHLLEESSTSAFLCRGEGGLLRVNYEQISSPATQALLPAAPASGSLASQGSWVYLVRDSGLETWDFSLPAAPAFLSAHPLPKKPVYIQLFEGRWLTASCQDAGVLLFDVAQPGQPVLAATAATTGSAIQTAIRGNLMAVAEGSTGVEIFDISQPSSPVKLATWNDKDGSVSGAAFDQSGVLWVVHSVFGTTSLDLTDLSQIKVIAKAGESEEKTGSLFVRDQFLYQATKQAGVFVLDIHDPAKPSSKAVLDVYTAASIDLTVPEVVLVADGYSGVKVVDVSDPDKPVVQAFLGLPGYCPGAVFLPSGEVVATTTTSGLFVAQALSCDGASLRLPCDGSAFTKFFPPLFLWKASSGGKYILKISLDPGFDKPKEMYVLGSESNPIRVPYIDIGFTGLEWLFRKASGKTLYWKVVYIQSGGKTESEVRTFTF